MNEIVLKTDKWRNEKGQLEVKMSEHERNRKEIQNKINKLESKKSDILTLTEKLRSLHGKITQLQKRQGATQRAEEKYKKILTSCFKGVLSSIDKRGILLQKISSQWEKNRTEEIKLQIYKLQNADIENSITSAKEALENSKKLYETIRSAYERLKTTYNTKKAKALEMCDNKNPNQPDFPFREKFESIANDLQTLNDEINDYQARVECMISENSNVIEEFEKRQKEIERLESVIMEGVQSTASNLNKITALHQKWYPKIKETVEEINKYFGEFMRSMQYVGEVQLIHDEDIVNINFYICFFFYIDNMYF